MEKDILQEYNSRKELYSSFRKKLESFISEVLSHHEIHIHTLTSRIKDKDSLRKKISKQKNYTSLDDITDICGLRITSYYEDDIERIASVIRENFDIDHQNSVNKKDILEPTTFGYLSLHYVISFNNERTDLIEYRRFKNLKAEIQIRSILQHAWAEIEHDLGYKNKVPVPIRRRFSMLAGLLELADREFIQIKEDIKNYTENLPDQIKQSPETVKVDILSLKQFLYDNPTFNEIQNEIDELKKFVFRNDEEDIDKAIVFLDLAQIRSISQLKDEIERNKTKIIKAIETVFIDDERDEVTVDYYIIIYYLFLMISAKNSDIERLNNKIETALDIQLDIDNNFLNILISIANDE